MSILGEKEMAEARADFAVIQVETGRVLVQGEVGDGAGGTEEGFEPGDDLDCAIEPVSSGEGRSGERIDARSTHIVTLPPLTTVRTVDRIEIDGWGTFEVTAVYKQSEPIDQRVEVREVI